MGKHLIEGGANEERLAAELTASQERERKLREALKRATAGHGLCGEWYCASCSWALKLWFKSGASDALPKLCVGCNHGALATPEGTVRDE